MATSKHGRRTNSDRQRRLQRMRQLYGFSGTHECLSICMFMHHAALTGRVLVVVEVYTVMIQCARYAQCDSAWMDEFSRPALVLIIFPMFLCDWPKIQGFLLKTRLTSRSTLPRSFSASVAMTTTTTTTTPAGATDLAGLPTPIVQSDTPAIDCVSPEEDFTVVDDVDGRHDLRGDGEANCEDEHLIECCDSAEGDDEDMTADELFKWARELPVDDD